MKLDLSNFYKILFSILIILIIINLIIYYLPLIISIINKKNINVKNENFINFKENTLLNNLSNIFKNDELNLKAYPNGDIKPQADFFKENKFLPECCMYYSDYSTSKGCPCITPEQQYYLKRRGGNRIESSFIHGEYSSNLYFSPSSAFKGKKENLFSPFIEIPKVVNKQAEKERIEFQSLINLNER